MLKMVYFAKFLNSEACGQTVLLPDKSILIGQKLVENAKIKKFKCDILSNFDTMCMTLQLMLILRLVLDPDFLKATFLPTIGPFLIFTSYSEGIIFLRRLIRPIFRATANGIDIHSVRNICKNRTCRVT